MNWYGPTDLPVTSATRQAAFFVIAQFEIDVDNTADSGGTLPRLPGVNRNQKGLWPHRQKASARIWRDQAGTHSNSL
jgi:hypothetical protein